METSTHAARPLLSTDLFSIFRIMKNADNTICRGFGQETTPQDIARIIGRIVKWGNEFEKFMDRCAPGFKQPHEARIYRHFWMEIDDQIREVAHALGDDRGTVMTYVHSGGVVQHKGGPIINTPTRLVNYLLNAKAQATETAI